MCTDCISVYGISLVFDLVVSRCMTHHTTITMIDHARRARHEHTTRPGDGYSNGTVARQASAARTDYEGSTFRSSALRGGAVRLFCFNSCTSYARFACRWQLERLGRLPLSHSDGRLLSKDEAGDEHCRYHNGDALPEQHAVSNGHTLLQRKATHHQPTKGADARSVRAKVGAEYHR